tara:strand:+ start:209 stop:328 length:120 start_codon:yes stop_codon:yes gene_type:complete
MFTHNHYQGAALSTSQSIQAVFITKNKDKLWWYLPGTKQ